mmetsp:Transcript_67999/g.157826  ORF Transcript_67999/g.157826 Transcript_67999/m.157826 type:complete len:203 (-) Transcript_67999:80-688(-)
MLDVALTAIHRVLPQAPPVASEDFASRAPSWLERRTKVMARLLSQGCFHQGPVGFNLPQVLKLSSGLGCSLTRGCNHLRGLLLRTCCPFLLHDCVLFGRCQMLGGLFSGGPGELLYNFSLLQSLLSFAQLDLLLLQLRLCFSIGLLLLRLCPCLGRVANFLVNTIDHVGDDLHPTEGVLLQCMPTATPVLQEGKHALQTHLH